jgi:isopenicillin N synthase-like dioxygenase
LHAWALALGQSEAVFDDAFADRPSTLLKIVRYPGRPEGTGGTDAAGQGVGSHKDAGVLTLLLVEPGTVGLQVEHPHGWIDAPPMRGAFVVNIGELLEVATNGYLKATVHRVLSPPPGTDRISVPFFYNPALSSNIPLLDLPPELAAEATGVTADPANPIHATYGANLLKSRLRAHPDVAARHHADLLR